MRGDLLELLINPYTGNRLERGTDSLVDMITRERFPIRNGIPAILRGEEVRGLNRLYQKRYDWWAYLYDLIMGAVVAWLPGASEAFRQIAEIMEVQSSDRVLETSIGTGMEIANLVKHGKRADFFGLDLSHGMLKKCRRNAGKWKLDIALVQGNAETVPFRDETFDTVFHIGGINFFNDKRRAVMEMIRVARPGANIYIGDETAKQLEEQPAIISRFYQKPEAGIYDPPVEHIPGNMLNVVHHTLFNGKMYLIAFQKPER